MKLIILIFSIFFLSIGIEAQNQNDSLLIKSQRELINNAIRSSNTIKSTKPIDELIASNNITFNELEVSLFVSKAEILTNVYNLLIYNSINDTASFNTHVFEVLECYSRAIMKANCQNKLHAQYKRYEFLQLLKVNENLKDQKLISIYNNEKNELKKYGLHPELIGFGFGVFLSKSNNVLIGSEFSLFSIKRERAFLKTTCNGKFFKIVETNSSLDFTDLFTIGYSRALNSKINDFSFSLIDFHSFIYFAPAKICFQINEASNEKYFHYMPEIGFGLGPVSISYSYNISLTKKAISTTEKHFLYLRISYPINDFWQKMYDKKQNN